MTVYALGDPPAEFIGVRSADPSDTGYTAWEMIAHEQRSVRTRWKHPAIEFSESDSAGKRVSRKKHPEWYTSDVLSSSPLIVTGRAANALRDLWERHGELLPVPSREGEFYAYHCMNIIDAIDRQRCEFERSKIVKYVFRPQVVRDQHIFLQAAPNEGPLFVSNWFVRRVESLGVRGFTFTPVWDDRIGPIAEEAPSHSGELIHAERVEPLNKSARQELIKIVEGAKRELKIDIDREVPELVVNRIVREIELAQGWVHRIDELVGVGTVLGSVWGELVCREFGWQWMMVDGVVAVTSPTRSHVVFVHAWVQELIRSGGQGPKCLQLFQMIKAGSLPQSDPGTCLVLA